MKKSHSFLLRLFMLALSIIILLSIVDFPLVFRYVHEVPFFILLILVCIGIIRTWLTGLRWRLLNPDASNQLSRWQYFRFLMIANTYNLIMPGALGGDFIKTALTLHTVKTKRADNLIGIIVDRSVGLLSILTLGTISFLFIEDVPHKQRLNYLFITLYIGIIISLFILSNPYLHKLLISFFGHFGKLGNMGITFIKAWKDTLRFFYMNKLRVLKAFSLCLPIHCVSFVTAYILAGFLNINISFFSIALITALVWLVTAIPITISGAGVRELSFIYLLSFYGVDPEPATALSLYKYIITLCLGLVGFFFWFNYKPFLSRFAKNTSRRNSL